MKDNRLRLPKWLRLALLLVLSGLLVFCMWLEARRPALSPQGALRQAEQAGLLEYGQFLTWQYTYPEHGETAADYHVAVSRTKTQLHTAEVERDGLLWRPNERALAVPVEDPVTAVLLPWQINIESDNTAYPAALVYCPDAANVIASLTIDGKVMERKTFSGRAGKGENGCWLVAFENLYPKENYHYLAVIQSLGFYYRYHRPIGASISVEITVFDHNGGILAEKTLEYS